VHGGSQWAVDDDRGIRPDSATMLGVRPLQGRGREARGLAQAGSALRVADAG